MNTALVNTATGEVLDAEAAEMRASFICTDLDGAADLFETAMDRMRAAIRDRDDLALGYRSPGDYLSDRFGGRLARLGVDLRREVVRELTEAGLSTRAIAPVLGVNQATVVRDGARDADASPQTPESPHQGARYLAVVDDDVVAGNTSGGSGQAPEGGETTRATLDPAPVVAAPDVPAPRPPVIGIDGKTYARPAPAPKPVLDGSAAEYANAETASLALSRAISKLLEFQHPNMRSAMRRNWSMASIEVPPTPRRDVTPEQMRVAAQGLLSLADEWGDR